MDLLKSLSPKPTARSMARLGERSMPLVIAWLRAAVSFSDTAVHLNSWLCRQDDFQTAMASFVANAHRPVRSDAHVLLNLIAGNADDRSGFLSSSLLQKR